PMGFYAPAQIVRDAREHGVEVLPVDINHSFWDCTLEPAVCPSPSRFAGPPLAPFCGEKAGGGGGAVRLGLRQIKGFAEVDAERLVAARSMGGYPDPQPL